MSELRSLRQGPVMRIRSASGFLSIFLLLIVSVAIAQSAETNVPNGAASEKSREPEVGPRGQRATREIKYGEWSKYCFKGDKNPSVCRTTISGNWDTGQTAVRIDLIEREGDGTARLQIFLPVGLYLQAGVKLTFDQGVPHRIPYSWCMTNMCIAADLADPKLVREMESSSRLTLEVADTNILTITTTAPLDRFQTARKGPPTQVFEQSIVE